MNKANITRYQELHHFNQVWMGGIHSYSKNTKALISSLHNKLSSVI